MSTLTSSVSRLESMMVIPSRREDPEAAVVAVVVVVDATIEAPERPVVVPVVDVAESSDSKATMTSQLSDRVGPAYAAPAKKVNVKCLSQYTIHAFRCE